METFEKREVQGLIFKAYGRMCNSRYTLLRVEDAGLARAWLNQLRLELSDGDHPAVETCLNIAFTYTGLEAIGLSSDNLRQFSREFREGMTDSHRQRILGDFGDSSPENWLWGGTRNDGTGIGDVHILMLIFAKNHHVLEAYWSQLEPVIAQHRLTVIRHLDTVRTKDNKEPFGFRDGISQPEISGLHANSDPNATVASGEFLLGYPNEYGVLPESPLIKVEDQQGDVHLLPTISPGLKDLGRNGSYLVFRQIQQHVDRFWDFMRRNSQSEDDAVKLASKMVGRWPSGAPLVKYPDSDPGSQFVTNDFGYTEDAQAQACPFGSHIRRSNPRDVLEENSVSMSRNLTKKHQLLRRGRPYSQPTADDSSKHEVGIHFLAFNTDFSRQFEFVQHTWCNNPYFNHLHNDPDPLVGVDATSQISQDFTVPGCPINRHVHGLERFITIRGGAYFFFPSFNAIRYFASL